MLSPDGHLTIRQPPLAQVFYVGFAVVWVALVLTQAPSGLPVAVVVLFAAFGVLTTARLVVMGVQGTPDGRLVVRNQLWTRTFCREDLADAVVDRGSGLGLPASGWTVWLVLQDGTRHRVQLTERPFLGASGDRLAAQAEEIRAWIRATSRPAPLL